MAKKVGSPRRRTPTWATVHAHAAGLDVGSRFHVAAVPADCCAEPVRTFQTFTGDLYRLAQWLQSVGITTVAMESTGVYWIPVFQILEQHGLEVLLVNAQHVKNVPGRKTDVNDAQWLQQLHQYGLLRGSFHPPAARRQGKHQGNQPNFAVREALYGLVGTDLSQLHGLGPYTALMLVGECGTDMSRWPTVQHFTSWLTLSPGNKTTGGRKLSSKTRRSSSRAAHLLRRAAVNVGKTDTALGAFYRRLSARTGKAKAVTATARKIAVLYYNALRYGMQYCDPGAHYYEEQYRTRVLQGLQRRARILGFVLVPEADA